MKSRWIAGIALALAACGLAKNGVGVAPRRAGVELSRYSQTRPSMGGLLTITIIAPQDVDSKIDASLGRAFEAVDAWEQRLSEWIADSPVSQINAAAGKKPIAVSAEVIHAFRDAEAVSRGSQGA